MVGPMQTPPQISPDGSHWWDGHAWQPMPLPNVGTSGQESEPQIKRPVWLPDGLEFPGPPSAPLSAPPADFGPPDGGIAARPWEPQAPPQSLLRKVLLWVGVVLGVGILLFGLLGIIAESERGRSGGMAVAVVLA
jgi:hypothetical protein